MPDWGEGVGELSPRKFDLTVRPGGAKREIG
jgi:hypothetical protein